jgi:hypothetical protein
LAKKATTLWSSLYKVIYFCGFFGSGNVGNKIRNNLALPLFSLYYKLTTHGLQLLLSKFSCQMARNGGLWQVNVKSCHIIFGRVIDQNGLPWNALIIKRSVIISCFKTNSFLNDLMAGVM